MFSSPSEVTRSRFPLGFNDSTLAFVGAAILISGAVLWTARGPNVERTDFSLSYVGARIVHDGGGSQLYNITLQKSLRDSLFQHPVPLFFEHPPFEALVLSPLAAHPFRTAYLVWGLTNATIWLAVILFLRPYFPWPGDSIGYISVWLLFAPLWVALYQGQSSILLMAAFALAFILLKRQKGFAAGMATGLGLFKFQFVLPFVFIFLLCRKWRFLCGFAISALALAFASVATVGWNGLKDYGGFVMTIGNNPQNISFGSGVDMPTIHGFVFAVLGRTISRMELNIFVAIFSLALLAWVASRWAGSLENPSIDRSFESMFSASVAASLLCGSHMFTHDFSPLILPMLLTAGSLSNLQIRFQASPRTRRAIKLTLVLFWAFPIYFLFVKWHSLYLMGPILLLFVWETISIAKHPLPTSEIAAVTG
jgi:hypothetical protein